MNENTEKKEKKTKPEEIDESISSQEKSSSSEEAQAGQTTTRERSKMKTFEMGEVFASVENLIGTVKKYDTKVTENVSGLISKVNGYFRNSIDSYKKTKTKH